MNKLISIFIAVASFTFAGDRLINGDFSENLANSRRSIRKAASPRQAPCGWTARHSSRNRLIWNFILPMKLADT